MFSKSRKNVLEPLRAGYLDFVINAEALAYMRERFLGGAMIEQFERLLDRRDDLLRVFDRPEILLHTNGSENDIRCHVIKRKISGGTRSDAGRDDRDAFLGLMKTCQKLGVSFFDYLGHRLDLKGAPIVAGSDYRRQSLNTAIPFGTDYILRHLVCSGRGGGIRTHECRDQNPVP